MNPAGSSKRDKRIYTMHGLTPLITTIKRGNDGHLIDNRTAVGKALRQWRQNLIDDLGGIQALSVQQLALVDLVTRTKLMADSVDAWLLTQPGLVNKRKRTLLPVVSQRTQLTDALARYLGMLGLERKKAEELDLSARLAKLDRQEEL